VAHLQIFKVEEFVLKGLPWLLWLPAAWYRKDAFIAVQTSIRGAQVLWLVCLYISVCLFTRISAELHLQSWPNFWCMLPTVMSWSSS